MYVILPCNINLTGAEIELVGAISRESRLKSALKDVKDQYAGREWAYRPPGLVPAVLAG